MSVARRTLLAAGLGVATLAPLGAAAREWGFGGRTKGCRGRETYVGAGLRPQLFPEVFDAAQASGTKRLRMVIDDGLDEAFDKAAAGLAGQTLATAVALPDGGLWNQLRTPRGEAEPTRFLWPAALPAWTATAALQMVEEGKLSLDDRLSRWAPQTPGAAHVRVEDLMAHTSGLAADQPPAFCPGANWAMSAADDALLARIVEAVDGAPHGEVMTRRIVERLGLEETTILAPGQRLEGLASAQASAAGGVAASAPDAMRAWRALMANRLHGAAITKGRFYRLFPVADVAGAYYGQGVMVSDHLTADRTWDDTRLGYSSASALVAYSLRTNAFAAVAVTGEGSAEAALRELFKGLPDAKKG